MRCALPSPRLVAATVLVLVAVSIAHAQGQTEAGIPVADALVQTRCGTCHAADQRGSLQQISWARATPEGWQVVVQRMIRERDVAVTPLEARAIVRYLSTRHGLAPEEAKPLMYSVERRVHDEAATLEASIVQACTRCHDGARALSWRRTPDGWRQFVDAHATRYRFTPDQQVIAGLARLAPFSSPEWAAWSVRTRTPELTGRWLMTAHVQGRGWFSGEMTVESAGAADEYLTRVRLESVSDGRVLERSGRSVVYAGTAWRGRSRGTSPPSGAPDDLSSDAREAMWVAPDGAVVAGRWFWGQYDELGFDVTMRRAASGPTVLLVDPPSLKTGSRGGRLRVIGDRFAAGVVPADISVGPGVAVRRIVSSTPGEIVAEVEVAAGAASGIRDVSVRGATLARAIAIFDRVDYVTVTPESSLATFGSPDYAPGVQQFEAIGYQRGADGKAHTADDLSLGPVPVAWSMEVFYETDPSGRARVGAVSTTGFFTPAATNPGTNFDVWIIATASGATGADGKPLVGKGYLVVTVPSYTFEGRTYVRDLGRWIETGSER